MTTISMERKRYFDQRKGIASGFIPSKWELVTGAILSVIFIRGLLVVTN